MYTELGGGGEKSLFKRELSSCENNKNKQQCTHHVSREYLQLGRMLYFR